MLVKINNLKGFHTKNLVEAGCDEAGRGCLAGPVFAAAVILPHDYSHVLLNDSKQVSHANRLILKNDIEINALAWAVATCSHDEIDKINILNASILAMHRALEKLTISPNHILVDGNKFKLFRDIKHTCVVKGDAIYKSIAAASILAKTYRDEHMESLDSSFPHYLWKKNKGYPTLEHRKAIQAYGLSDHHRKTFNSGMLQLKLF
jgi:ribonuclease HII